jgi:hypothetical protein
MGTNTVENVFSQNNAFIFIDNGEQVFVNTNGINLITKTRQTSGVGQMERMSKSEWEDALNKAYEDYKVPEAIQILPPHEVDEASYPTEEEWCGGLAEDPSCTDSPYKEPDAKVNAGAIAGFCILGVATLIAAMYSWYRYRLAKQKRRMQKRFIAGIAQNITIGASAGALSQEALIKEFEHIDKDKGGSISKDE